METRMDVSSAQTEWSIATVILIFDLRPRCLCQACYNTFQLIWLLIGINKNMWIYYWLYSTIKVFFKYSPPCSSHHIFFLQPVLTLLVQSSVVHSIVVAFGQKLNVPIFSVDRYYCTLRPRCSFYKVVSDWHTLKVAGQLFWHFNLVFHSISLLKGFIHTWGSQL